MSSAVAMLRKVRSAKVWCAGVALIAIGTAVACKTVSSKVAADGAGSSGSAILSDDAPLDIIDTAFLLPLPTAEFSIKAKQDAIGPISSEIMPADQFAALPKAFREHQEPEVQGGDLLDQLHITGFRYDPCFPIVTSMDPNGPGCRLRAIRLVGQFISDGAASPASMHILFVTKSPDPNADYLANDGIVKALKNLRRISGVRTAGVSLGVHPGFSGPNAREFQQQVKGMILSFAGRSNFFATSIFFKNRNASTWNWLQALNLAKPNAPAGTICFTKRGAAPQTNCILTPIPTTGTRDTWNAVTNSRSPLLVTDPETGATSPIMVGQFKVQNGKGRTVPGPDQLRNESFAENALFFPVPLLGPLFDPEASVSDLAKAVVGADAFENPNKMTIPAGDCASCHAATQYRLNAMARGDVPLNRQLAFQAPPGITSVMDPAILATMSTPTSESNILLNFGYHGSKPVISQRTVNEAVMVTLLINTTMLNGGWGPAATPTTSPAVSE